MANASIARSAIALHHARPVTDARQDPTGFPCPHDRVRDGMARMHSGEQPPVYRQHGLCLVCGYAVERERPPGVKGERLERYTPWRVVSGGDRDSSVVRRAARG